MTTANALTPKEVAALLVIGDKILSGRTKDKNIGYIAEYLTALGIDLREVRVVGDEETAIVDALNALRHRYTYVFTTGGIGPAHDDITSDCVAKAFGVPIDVDPRALAILHEWLKVTGAEMSEARMRMTRIPKGADLVLNEVSGAPGFWIGNVIVMAGVPSIIFDAHEQLLVHHPRDEGQNARPIHSVLHASRFAIACPKNRNRRHPARLCSEWTTHRLFDSFNFLAVRGHSGVQRCDV
jgi:molybdenum cofactor synthesis domain-containing protein